ARAPRYRLHRMNCDAGDKSSKRRNFPRALKRFCKGRRTGRFGKERGAQLQLELLSKLNCDFGGDRGEIPPPGSLDPTGMLVGEAAPGTDKQRRTRQRAPAGARCREEESHLERREPPRRLSYNSTNRHLTSARPLLCRG